MEKKFLGHEIHVLELLRSQIHSKIAEKITALHKFYNLFIQNVITTYLCSNNIKQQNNEHIISTTQSQQACVQKHTYNTYKLFTHNVMFKYSCSISIIKIEGKKQ